jgi:hypothetical protein
MRPLIATPDRLLRRSPQEMALTAARQSDEAITAALRGEYDSRKTYGPLRDGGSIDGDDYLDDDDGDYDDDDYDDDGASQGQHEEERP